MIYGYKKWDVIFVHRERKRYGASQKPKDAAQSEGQDQVDISPDFSLSFQQNLTNLPVECHSEKSRYKDE